MKRLSMAAVVLASGLAATDALAANYFYHGSGCRPVAASAGWVEYSQYGIHNWSSTQSVTVYCPIDVKVDGALVLTHVQVTGYDRSTSADLSCDLQSVDSSGNVIYSVSGHSSGGGAGSGATTVISTDVPIPNGSFAWYLRCSIPAMQTSGWFSHITTISLTANN